MAIPYQPANTSHWPQLELGEYEYDYFFSPEAEEGQSLGSLGRMTQHSTGRPSRPVNGTCRQAAECPCQAARQAMELDTFEDALPASSEEINRERRPPIRRNFRPRPRSVQTRPAAKRMRPANPRPRNSSKPPRVRPANVRRPVKVISRPRIVQTPQPASEYMRWVQRALNDVLGSNLIVDGVPDRTTRNAIRDFQKQNQLPIDGIAGPTVKEALIKARADHFKRQKSAV